jgi:hypothetical protein
VGEAKLITKLIDRGESIKREMFRYTRLFFKQILSQDIDLKNANKFALLAAKAEQDCEQTFNTLVNRFPKNVNVNRIYGRYLEEVKNDPEAAVHYYTNAEIIEEEEAERTKLRNGILDEMRDVEEEPLHVPSSPKHIRPRSNSISPALPPPISPMRLTGNFAHPKDTPSEKDEVHTTGSIKHDQDSVMSAVTIDKTRPKFLTQLYTRERHTRLRIGMYMIAPVLCCVIIILASVLETTIPFVNTSTLLNSCLAQDQPYRSKFSYND